ncbi:MAG: nucleoside triphosphate pyrophosphohydrolase [Proteobacteria bacterium]|nr:nucleoside triphosphate pyrophosphohydrolase [Pseudomonadota bacterium]
MKEIEKLLDIMRKLRDPETGCPWDLEQDFSTIAPYTIEEAYEVADAIEREDWDGLRSELGDFLLQVVFHAQMAGEKGYFAFDDVVAGINDKMIRRHPHVFSDEEQREAHGVRGRWEEIKEEERAGAGDGSALAGVARALPALMRAQKLGKRAAHAGFDWPDRRGVRLKVREELDEVEEAAGTEDGGRIEEELGDLLFAVVNLARHHDVDPEKALMRANGKFERRFRAMEDDLASAGLEMRGLSVESLDRYWRKAKVSAG